MCGTHEQHAKGDGEKDDTHMDKKNYKSYDLLNRQLYGLRVNYSNTYVTFMLVSTACRQTL